MAPAKTIMGAAVGSIKTVAGKPLSSIKEVGGITVDSFTNTYAIDLDGAVCATGERLTLDTHSDFDFEYTDPFSLTALKM